MKAEEILKRKISIRKDGKMIHESSFNYKSNIFMKLNCKSDFYFQQK